MAAIALTWGEDLVLGDDEDRWLSQYDWRMLNRTKERNYAVTIIGGHEVLMHRLITAAPPGMEVDHINHDTLDNRKENLRVCTKSQNQLNRHKARADSSSGIPGVGQHKNKWRARIQINGEQIHIGLYGTKEEASKAYAEANKYAHQGEIQ